MELKECQGYKKLLESVMHDVSGGRGCFDAEGCNNPKPIEYPVSSNKNCFHRYCNKFKWVIDRVNHYADKTGIDASDILDAWESQRDYWYMNFYQDCNQPLLNDDKVRVFDTIDALKDEIGPAEFRCPVCGGISSSPYTCNSGKEMSPGKICDWKAYGFFGCAGKGVTVFVREKMKIETFFMPVAWETSAELVATSTVD